MEKTITSSNLRNQLSTILDEVQFEQESYIVERKKKPAVAIVPLAVYESWKARRAELFASIADFQASSGDNDPDAIMEMVLAAQEASRHEN